MDIVYAGEDYRLHVDGQFELLKIKLQEESGGSSIARNAMFTKGTCN